MTSPAALASGENAPHHICVECMAQLSDATIRAIVLRIIASVDGNGTMTGR